MLKRKNALLTILLSFNLLIAIQAQETTTTITLEEAIAEALNSNRTIQISQTDEKIAEANLYERQPEPLFCLVLHWLT